MSGEAATDHGPTVGQALRPTSKSLPGDARARNRSLVLRTLVHTGHTTRADVARATGLPRVTVSALVADLIREGLVEDLGPRPDRRTGKPATIVSLIPGARHIIALDLSDAAVISGALVDLRGQIIDQRSWPRDGATGDDALEKVRAAIVQLRQTATSPVLGVGIGSPGIITPAGRVVEAPNYAWSDLPMAELLAARLALPVHVANDANTAALAEFTFGGSDGSGLMVITVGHGLGAGIVADGVALRGHSFAAGEIGHVTAVEDGELCGCGRRGCLETVFSAPALRRLGSPPPPAALAEVGRLAGGVLAPVVSALNLHEIVLSGPAELLTDPLATAIAETIDRRVMPSLAADLQVRPATRGEALILTGAAGLVLSGELGVT
jgi:predicted NBD/HSP70 family sugar kinase